MRLIFSKDRAAQLDLLLTSLMRNAESEDTRVIFQTSSDEYWEAYTRLIYKRGGNGYYHESRYDFEERVRTCLALAGNFVTFFCDDDVLFATDKGLDYNSMRLNDRLLCCSLRLGENTIACYPTGFIHEPPQSPWEWLGLRGDWSYPGSLDGHIFRTADVRHMLRGRPFRNPTELEDALMAGCFEMSAERPLMVCYQRSVLCSVPVNRVSEQSQVRAGERFPVSAEKLNERFLDGWRLDLDALDFSGVDSAHYEVDLESAWRRS